MYLLREVLFLVVCGTIGSADDYDDSSIGARRTSLAVLSNSISAFLAPIGCGHEPHRPQAVHGVLFSWVAACWPDKLDLMAIDGKTSRRTVEVDASIPPIPPPPGTSSAVRRPWPS
jgi:hypothetical protein